jgi:hypothetical protein
MGGSAVRLAANILILPAILALGACGSLPEMDTFRAPDASTLFRPLSVSSGYKDRVLVPVAPEDLVDASGRCSGAFVPATAEPGSPAAPGQDVSLQQAGVPLIPAAIALDMSECDVVKRAGVADRVDIASASSPRNVTLTYLRGDRPGTYGFVDGRLRSMEAVPEQEAPVKPAKRSAKGARPAAKPAAKPVAKRVVPKDEITVQ